VQAFDGFNYATGKWIDVWVMRKKQGTPAATETVAARQSVTK
jgi:hypothetical protein